MSADRLRVIVIAGPTAVGKTALSLELANHLPLEIVCADSRQVYTMMDIGTAKPTKAEMARCRHHLFDVYHPSVTYNAGKYAEDVRRTLSNKLGTFVLVGGSGLYINAALDGFSVDVAETDENIRLRIREFYRTHGREALYQWLVDVDPVAAERYADKNPRRIQRALEYYVQHGVPFSSTWAKAQTPLEAEVHRFVVDMDREELNVRIEERCAAMWNEGLLEETQAILADGVAPEAQSLRTVGYTQALGVLGYGTPLSMSEAQEQHVVATKQYVKRQRTWFRKDPRFQQVTPSNALDAIMRSLAVLLMFLVGVAAGSAKQGVDTAALKSTRSPFISQYDSVQAVARLAGRIDELLRSKAYRSASVSCRVWNMSRNKLVYDLAGDLCLTPASTTKLFSTAAAFHALGEKGALTTEVRATGRILNDGTLEGDLYLVGMGDAMLSVNDLERMADELYRMGIRRVRGSIYGDGSFFDNIGNRAVYSGDNEEVQPLPAVRALSVNESSFSVIVSATRAGRVSAQTIPACESVVINLVSSAPSPKRRRRGRSRCTVSSTYSAKDNVQYITVAGSPGANRTRSFSVPMAEPSLMCAGIFASRLRAGGISVDGKVGTRRYAAESRVLVKTSRSLTEFCSVVNKRSHNYFAEQIFKVVGGQYGGRTNTAATAKEEILATLDSLKVPRRGAVFNDGSGLSRRNRVCAATQVDLLRAINNRSYGDEFRSTLAIAAVDGTIRGRMHNSPAAGNVHAKTGTLRNVSALSGYVTTLDGEQWCFSVISNGPSPRTYKSIENQVAIALAGFSYSGKQWTPTASTAVKSATDTSNDDEFENISDDTDKDILDTLLLLKHPKDVPSSDQRKQKPKKVGE